MYSLLQIITALTVLATATASGHPIAPTVACSLQIQLDDQPSDTAWEIRGPFPSVDLVSHRDYDHYESKKALAKEALQLQAGGTYHLVLTDYANNGIQDGHFAVTTSNNEHTDTTLVEGDGDFGAGQVYTFTVPDNNKAQPPSIGILKDPAAYMASLTQTLRKKC